MYFLICLLNDLKLIKIINFNDHQLTEISHEEKWGLSMKYHLNSFKGNLIYQFYLLFFQGKVKSVTETRGGPPLEPTPNYDCHVSKAANIDLSSVSLQLAFESTQVETDLMTPSLGPL